MKKTIINIIIVVATIALIAVTAFSPFGEGTRTQTIVNLLAFFVALPGIAAAFIYNNPEYVTKYE